MAQEISGACNTAWSLPIQKNTAQTSAPSNALQDTSSLRRNFVTMLRRVRPAPCANLENPRSEGEFAADAQLRVRTPR